MNNTTAYERAAWDWIIANWGTTEWKPIPKQHLFYLHLDSRLGVCHHSVITKVGAEGMEDMISYLNRPRIIKKKS